MNLTRDQIIGIIAIIVAVIVFWGDKIIPPSYENPTPIVATIDIPTPNTSIQIQGSNCIVVGIQNNDQNVSCEISPTPTR